AEAEGGVGGEEGGRGHSTAGREEAVAGRQGRERGHNNPGTCPWYRVLCKSCGQEVGGSGTQGNTVARSSEGLTSWPSTPLGLGNSVTDSG
ncbi:unnamed protein product, partial [Ectocarpus fasciculatus]